MLFCADVFLSKQGEFAKQVFITRIDGLTDEKKCYDGITIQGDYKD